MRNKIYLIGIGFKPLEKKAQEILFNAPLILAFPGTLRIFKKYEIYSKVKEKIKVCSYFSFWRSSLLWYRTKDFKNFWKRKSRDFS